MRRFLKLELDRYLERRGRELADERPLVEVEFQPYIYYNKASVVTYALRDHLGQATVNRAIRRLLDRHALRGAPYPISTDLVALLREEAPAEAQGLITDLLETITLFSNRTLKAEAEDLGGGRHRVRLEVEARKFRADGQGVEEEIPVDDWIDIGIYGADDKVLFLDKRRLTSGTAVLEIEVDGEPVSAGIDPRNILIDRDSDDNTSTVSIG
jgi:aminopeptidase N